VNRGQELSDADAFELAERVQVSAAELDGLLAAAAERRDRHWGREVTFSPKVFLPLTNICRNRCDYCSFRRSPGEQGAWTMSHEEVDSWLARAAAQGCVEALLPGRQTGGCVRGVPP
jgi:FO synthase